MGFVLIFQIVLFQNFIKKKVYPFIPKINILAEIKNLMPDILDMLFNNVKIIK